MAVVTPTPTFAPTGVYVPPPSHSVTLFTPAPSCSPEKLWLVSTQLCDVNGGNQFNGRFPSWAECALTLAGDPHSPYRNIDCYPWNLEAEDGTHVFISECPVGYTTVWESQGRQDLYDTSTITQGGTIATSVEYRDIVAHSAVCCPDNALGGFHYNWDSKPDYIDYIQTADPNGNPEKVNLYVPPRCVANSICAVPPTVTLDVIFNSEVSDKKRRRQDTPPDNISPVGVVTRPWDANKNVVFAHSVEFGYTVFHGTYTCFENCYDYASYSYHNTDPNSPPSSIGPDDLETTADFKPEQTQCSASPTDSGPSETSPPDSPPVGTGGSGYSTPSTGHRYNATQTEGGYFAPSQPSGDYSTSPSKTDAGYEVSPSETNIPHYSPKPTIIETIVISTHTFGESAGWNATATGPGYSTTEGTGEPTPGAPEESETGAPLFPVVMMKNGNAVEETYLPLLCVFFVSADVSQQRQLYLTKNGFAYEYNFFLHHNDCPMSLSRLYRPV
ncbi:hypothetical protein P171DRAFT_438547 [Karstenula rhodostoma CBS 690.94]|uniref:Uncharacterized protein n=1 Tax=Karstenula rhodostoma CBS 690.94 TaxID=1392251 RepID=A0A9P4PWR3_9PLEO|nr:hypothetical protein P171DRAFT_438547 [Karstenula rhodostoma CBS 690.94]